MDGVKVSAKICAECYSDHGNNTYGGKSPDKSLDAIDSQFYFDISEGEYTSACLNESEVIKSFL